LGLRHAGVSHLDRDAVELTANVDQAIDQAIALLVRHDNQYRRRSWLSIHSFAMIMPNTSTT
jgi:hypothetical protein